MRPRSLYRVCTECLSSGGSFRKQKGLDSEHGQVKMVDSGHGRIRASLAEIQFGRFVSLHFRRSLYLSAV